MKKSTIIATSIVCGGLLLFGCTNPAAPANISQKLERNLTALTNVVNRLDTIENSYLSNPDIHPTTYTVSAPAPNSNKKVIAKIGTDDYTLSIPINNRYKNKIANIDTYNKAAKQNPDSTTNFYYYNVQPTKYSPRYIGTQNNDNEDYLKHYINKVRTLYSITNDAIEANNELGKFKNDVITYCVEIKQLNSAIENGTFVPSTNQIAALNNYIDDIKVTIKRIKDCNGDLSNEVNNINNKDVGGITAGIDVINSNYLSVLNHIDTRISYLKNAITTLEQIKYILQEAQEIIINNPSTLEELENNIVVENEAIIEQVENENKNEQSFVDNTIENNEQLNNEIENNTLIEDDLGVKNEATDTVIENEENLEETSTNELNKESSNEQSEVENNTDIQEEKMDENNIIESSFESNNQATEIEELEPTPNQTGTNNIDTNNVEDPEIESENKTNIDSYLNTNNNLDTYKPVENNIENNDKQNDIDSTNTDATNNNNLQTMPHLNGNNIVNNNMLVPTDEEKINAPNGTFQNGIITQNNLNNGVNNGVNGTTTGYSGSSNNPIVNNNNIRTNKNVDTYGHNTIIDMINHGTVNNGINTLSVSDESKPTMVSSTTTLEETYDDENCVDDCFENNCETCTESNESFEELEENFEDNNSTM